jgi:hypothetical protein
MCTPCQGVVKDDFEAGMARLVVLDRAFSPNIAVVVLLACASASLSSELLVGGRRFCPNTCR